MDGYYIPLVATPQIGGGGGGGGGSGSGVLVVTVTKSGNTWTCDKTAGEMYAAMSTGGVVFSYVKIGGAEAFDSCVFAEYEEGEGYGFASSQYFSSDGLVGELWCETENDYPGATVQQ